MPATAATCCDEEAAAPHRYDDRVTDGRPDPGPDRAGDTASRRSEGVAPGARRPRAVLSERDMGHPAVEPLSTHRSMSMVPVGPTPGPVPGPAAEVALDESRLSDVDEWGRSEHVRSITRRLYDPIYRHWFRVEWQGLEKIPTTGGALLIANHAGAIPSDAPAIMHGVEQELGRPVYGLADYFFRTIPVVGTLWSRTGGVPAHPDNAYRLLHDQQQLALVFPEGTKATSKTYKDRYRLRRFGRGGFVEIAMRAGVPVIPIAVIGAEESMPILFRVPGLAKVLNIPYFPVTANALLMGPLGYAVYFPAKMKMRVLDPVTFDVEPGLERYSRSRVMDEGEAVRARMQETIFDMLRERRSVWFG